MLKAYLDEAALRYRLVSVSACHSGGFIPPLADSHTFIVTAAHAARRSFGCGNESEITAPPPGSRSSPRGGGSQRCERVTMLFPRRAREY
jgi:hypothetical protein